MDDFLDPQDRQTQNAEAQKKAQLFDRQLRESFAALTSTPESWSIERMNRSPKSSVWYSMYLSSTASK